MDSRSAEQIEESTEKLLHDLKAVVRDGEELLKAGAKDLGEKGMAARDRLAAALQTARETGRKLEEQAVAGVKAAERLIRQHPYESLVVELQQERGRLFELLAWVVALLFFSVMATLLATAIIIFLIPEDYRLYAAAGFTLFYLAGALWSAFIVHRFLTRVPFPETVAQVKKDRAWLESFK